MSTILKALKRVDQSTPPPDDLQSGPSMMDTKNAVKGRLFRIWLRRKAVMALIVLGGVLVAGWLIYSQKDWLMSKIGSTGQSKKPPVFQAKIKPPPGQLKRQPASNATKPGRDRLSEKRPAETSSRSSSAQQGRTDQMTTMKPQIRVPESKSSSTSEKSNRSDTKAGGSSARKTRPPTAAPVKKPKSRTAPAARSYPRLDNASLKLQAIAWSNIAAERIAVINDRIVREGESVEGYSINQIRQDEVIVNDGSQSWQLEFGLR